jgi:hypothetical protein
VLLLPVPFPPVEFVTPGGDPVAAPVEGGDGSGTVPAGANEFTFSTAATGSFTLTLKVHIADLASQPQSFRDNLRFEVDAVGDSVMVWDAANAGGVPTVNGEELTATVTFSGLPASHTGFGRKQARVVLDGTVLNGVALDGVAVAAQAFEVFFPRDAANHPGLGAGTSLNWFYYWNQAVGDPEARWDDSGHTVYGEVPFMHDWGSGTTEPVRRIFIAADLKEGDGIPIRTEWEWHNRAVTTDTPPVVHDNLITGIDAFYVTMLHERRHVTQIKDSDKLPFWKRNGLAQDGVAYSGWAWDTTTHPPYDNHFDPGPDGVKGGGNDTDLDDDLDYLGKDPRPGGMDFDGGFNGVEHQAREVETVADNTKAALDWGSPGKNHQTINNPHN